MVGDRIRETRLSQQRSLVDVAGKANISAATLSRIENNKQGINLGLFVTLASVLKTAPRELLDGETDDGVEHDPLVRRITGLQTSERTQLWHELADSVRARRTRRGDMRNLSQQVEELLAQTEFLREELVAVQNRLGRQR